MKKIVLTLSLSIFAALPAFASIEGTVAQSLFNQMKGAPGVVAKTDTMRLVELKSTTDTLTTSGVYCVVTHSTAGEQATCAFNGQTVNGDAMTFIKTLGDAGVFLGKPVQAQNGALRDLSLQTLSCERNITITSDFNHRIPAQISYSCTVGL